MIAPDSAPTSRAPTAFPLVEQLAVCVAGQVSEEVFGQLLPSWASGGDRGMVINLLLANKVPAPETGQLISVGLRNPVSD